MPLPFNTTTISVLRAPNPDTTDVDGDTEPEDGWPDTERVYSPVATDVRAVISAPGGTYIQAGSLQEDMGLALACDPCGLLHTDRVLDERTGITYLVKWAYHSAGFGLAHDRAGLRLVSGGPE